MRDFLAACTLLACVAVFVASAVSIFRPLPRVHLATRKQSIMGFGVAFALFVLTAIIIPPVAPTKGSTQAKPTPSASSSGDAAETSAEAEEQAISPDQKAAAIGFYKAMFSAMKGCDTAAKETADVVNRLQRGSGNIYDGYSAATAQVAACRESWSETSKVEIPDELSGESLQAAEKAKDICGNTALAKQMVAETAQEVFDGDTKPSKIQEMKQRAETAQAGIMACAANTMVVALRSGVDVKDLPKQN